MEEFYIMKILFFATLAFVFTIAWTPLLTYFLYRYKLGKRIRNNGNTPVFSSLHAHKAGTPTMGGVLIWLTTLIFSLLFFYLAKLIPWEPLSSLNFLTRSETWLPLGALVLTALIGLMDDWLDIRGKGVFGGGGLKIKHRLLIYTVIAVVGAWWFFFKLEWDVLLIPFIGYIKLGWVYMVVFIAIIVATSFSVNETDGLDGLAGGVLLVCFAAYGIISFSIGKYDLATFCAVIAGSLLAFLWFNIAPARFYMGDTGAMSLGVTLGIIAMLTNRALLLPIIGFVFLIESVSVIVQLASKRLRNGKKIFISTPLHHHLEAIGWPETKIVMRLWVIAWVSAAVGLIIFLLDNIR